ncbi:MAG: BamA/TamA family outer membrane protein [Proteobacteria bacterium]|nr:BamA/TamA family outer membrane protein [Pseudomonadota bacterium]MBU1389905.1 BamA/TamA family outer membrane protein [Pseudomonadota bacterium]MBU1543914.1 BamA/TamA family outer membrane protein [Pseudomonadota bacterium]MBU2482192.1 BamA/TamA family outer membrane protein [Pseudomonadota bacterium]
MRNTYKRSRLLGMAFIVFMLAAAFPVRQTHAQDVTFVIHSFNIQGNTVLSKDILTAAVLKFAGKGKTAQDVELARDALEKVYHKSGYPTVLVNIPEQTVDDGIVRFQVIEGRIKRVFVKGNKYFTMENIKEQLPAIQEGNLLYLPQVREELSKINRNPDLKVSPVLIPGKELGKIDVELNVEDALPLHGELELNNRSTHTTTDTRLNAMIRYDNLWQKRHSINAQFQTAPQKTDEVMVFSSSYSMPAPWNHEHLMIGYFINSDSETASGVGFNVIGKGRIFGFRYMTPLPSQGHYDHNLILGFDWKDFEEDTLGGEFLPNEYVPVSFGYASYYSGSKSLTQFSADLNMIFRDLFMNDTDEFRNKRAGATGNYIYLRAGMEHRHQLPKDFSFFIKIDGQLSDQPMINNEQYAAGGVDSVRGYKESELLEDNAIHTTVELFSPDLLKKNQLRPYLFYDCAWLGRREAGFEEDARKFIQSIGVGLTGNWKETITYKLDWGYALKDTDATRSGDQELHFKIKYQF